MFPKGSRQYTHLRDGNTVARSPAMTTEGSKWLSGPDCTLTNL